MKFLKDIMTIIGGVWLVDKGVTLCFTLGEMNATYQMSKKLRDDIIGHKESE